jgi:hypothetical protein
MPSRRRNDGKVAARQAGSPLACCEVAEKNSKNQGEKMAGKELVRCRDVTDPQDVKRPAADTPDLREFRVGYHPRQPLHVGRCSQSIQVRLVA